MIVSKTRNAPDWATKADNLMPYGVRCNDNVIWVSVLRLQEATISKRQWFFKNGDTKIIFGSHIKLFKRSKMFFSFLKLDKNWIFLWFF